MLEADLRWKMMRAGQVRSFAWPRGLPLVTWLNVTRDVPWEREHPELFRGEFENVQFLDYTGDFSRLEDPRRPPNYHLTLVLNDENRRECRLALELGHNVAALFPGGTLPKTYLDVPVVDGSAHPYRFLDPPGVVVGMLPRPESSAT